jgi:two-component system, NarL family, sensor histidine kinase DegS
MDTQSNENENLWEVFEKDVQIELDQSRRALKEVTMMLEQSQAELAKLTQRNQVITNNLRQIQSQIDTAPRADIRVAYDTGLDVQHRLLVMRGQLEKLQSDQENTQRMVAFLEKTQGVLVEGIKKGQPGRPGSASATLEMVINAQEAVRQRLSMQMHDGPAQALSNFILRMDIANRLMEIDPNQAKQEMADLKVEATRTFAKVKSFISELRPMMLDDLGLIPTLTKYGENFKEQTGMDVVISVNGQDHRLEPYLEIMVFRAVQELMGNTVRHNIDYPMKITVNVQVSIEENQIRLSVSDNGKGFDPEKLKDSPGVGLKLIRERVEILGGYMDIDAGVGQGCKVSFTIPTIDRELVSAKTGS